MSSTIVIKVAFQGINRQLRVPTSITFTQLAQQVSQLFQVNGDVTLLYHDEDQDLVSVNSDMELVEAFAYVGKDGKLRAQLRVDSAEEQVPIVAKIPTPNVDIVRPPSTVQPSQPEPYKVTSAGPVEEYDGEDEDELLDEPIQEDSAKEGPITKEQLVQQFLTLLQQHQDLLALHPMLSAHANTLADQVITEIQGQEANEPAAEEHVDAVRALESVLQVVQEFQPQVMFVRRGGCPGRSMRGCMRPPQRFHPWGPQPFRRCGPSDASEGFRRCAPSEEERAARTQNQLKHLADMGFTDEKVNKDLLNRYHGDMERVVELLTRQGGEEKDYLY